MILGIGSDNALLFCKIWECVKAERNAAVFIKLLQDAMEHAAISSFASSVTTAAALYSTYISNITVIKCFRYPLL